MSDVVPAPDPPEPDTSGLAATIAAPGQDTRDPLVLRQGKVTAVTPGVGEASVCSVSIGGAAAIDNVRHLCDTPDVDDVVWLIQNGPDRLILGVVGGSDKAGTIKWIGGTGGAPNGWWPCDGRSTSGYPKLAARYGATIPDLRNRFIVASGTDYAVGATGGESTHVLTTAELPGHVHSLGTHNHTAGANGGHSHAQNISADTGTGSAVRADYQADVTNGGVFPQGINTGSVGDHTHITSSDGAGNTGSVGSGIAVENRPLYYALLAIIKFG